MIKCKGCTGDRGRKKRGTHHSQHVHCLIVALPPPILPGGVKNNLNLYCLTPIGYYETSNKTQLELNENLLSTFNVRSLKC
jgi:hypothetical protein